MLDALPQAIFGLDGTGLLLFANASADRLLACGDCLRCEGGRLATAMPAQQPQLDMLIANTLSGSAGGAMRIGRLGDRLPCAARVSRIVVGETERFLQPAVLVVVSDPAAAAPIDEDALRTLYDLTPAEARTAAALLAGHSIHSAAQLLGVAGETLRSHLKSIFRKVGVSRQQDLIRILAELEMSSIAMPLISPE
jgi:DNA-binding CsgD family transcriptional regulator